ncbi:MAG: hypothetical protein ACT4N9_01850 [Paracoccaceae bacterium]
MAYPAASLLFAEKTMIHRLALASAATLMSAGLSLAGPITDLAASVESRLANGDYAAAVAEARAVLAMVWDQSPGIGFTDSVLVIEPASGYGIFNPRAGNAFRPGEPIVIYAEPFGYGFGSPGEGLYSIGFFVDLQVMDAKGEVLADVPNVADLEMSSRFPNKEFQANITYSLDGLAPGKYRLITTLRDKYSPKLGSFEIEVEIAG